MDARDSPIPAAQFAVVIVEGDPADPAVPPPCACETIRVPPALPVTPVLPDPPIKVFC